MVWGSFTCLSPTSTIKNCNDGESDNQNSSDHWKHWPPSWRFGARRINIAIGRRCHYERNETKGSKPQCQCEYLSRVCKYVSWWVSKCVSLSVVSVQMCVRVWVSDLSSAGEGKPLGIELKSSEKKDELNQKCDFGEKNRLTRILIFFESEKASSRDSESGVMWRDEMWSEALWYNVCDLKWCEVIWSDLKWC